MLLAALLMGPIPAAAAPSPVVSSAEAPEDLRYLSVNAGLGALAAGLSRAVRGDFSPGAFLQGALGGAVSYSGKRLGGEAFDGAGLLGRQLAALGSSVVRSAAQGGGVLDTLFVPVGPGWLQLGTAARASYRVDVEQVAWVAYGFTRPHLDFDLGASLSSGAFVFAGDERLRGEDDDALGRAAPGVISLRRLGDTRDAATLAHERVHIAQLDHLKIVAGRPLEGWFRELWGIPSSGSFWGRVEAGVGHYPFLWLLTAPWPAHGSRPLEREAEFIEAKRAGG